MIVVSAVFIVVALALLLVGLAGPGLGFVYGSIVTSLVAITLLLLGVLQRREVVVEESPEGDLEARLTGSRLAVTASRARADGLPLPSADQPARAEGSGAIAVQVPPDLEHGTEEPPLEDASVAPVGSEGGPAAEEVPAQQAALDARHEAERILIATRREAAQTLRWATTTAERTVREARDEAEQILAAAGAEAERTLTAARRQREDQLARAREDAEELISSAQRHSEQMVAQSTTQRDVVLGELEPQRKALEQQIEGLRGLEQEYRSRLVALIESLRHANGEAAQHDDAALGRAFQRHADRPELSS